MEPRSGGLVEITSASLRVVEVHHALEIQSYGEDRDCVCRPGSGPVVPNLRYGGRGSLGLRNASRKKPQKMDSWKHPPNLCDQLFLDRVP